VILAVLPTFSCLGNVLAADDRPGPDDDLPQGKRTKNGWKNSGIPWTYDLDPQRMYLPELAGSATPAVPQSP
jgi:hypothetical protein